MKPVSKIRLSDMPAFSDSRTAPIGEIFSSLQGEGPFMGERHLFIRFSGCDVGCSYCDENSKPGREMPLADALAEVEKLERDEGPHSFVSVTGGEPLRQRPFLERLLPELKRRRFKVLLETNGILWQELERVLGLCDAVSMDLKLASVGGHEDFLEEHGKFLRIACAGRLSIKLVVSKGLDLGEFDRHIKMIAGIAPGTPVFIQPAWQERTELNDLLTELIQRAQKQLQDVRLGIQIHKMLNMR